MSNNSNRSIYEFTVNVEREIDKTTTKEEDGKTIVVTEKVKEPVPVFISFQKPSRAEREEADEFRLIEINRLITKGVMTEAIMRQKYENNGGVLTDNEIQYRNNLKLQLTTKLDEYQRAFIAGEKELANTAMKDIVDLRELLIRAENDANVFYENTAEARARNKLTEYLILNFTKFRTDPNKPYEPYFKGETLAQKYDSLEALSDNSDGVYLQIRDKLVFVAALYIALNGNVTKEDIKAFEEELGDREKNTVTDGAAAAQIPAA